VPSNRSRTHGATKAQRPTVFAGEANAGVGRVDDLRPGRHVGGVGLGQEGVTQAVERWPPSRASPRWKTRSPSSGKALYRAASLAVGSSLQRTVRRMAVSGETGPVQRVLLRQRASDEP
jgi:hypothetical protein